MLSWVKRIVPFVATFALGLLVASFFVSIGLPKIKYKKANCFDRQYESKRERYENRLKAEQKAREEAERARDEAIKAQNEAYRTKSRAEKAKRNADKERDWYNENLENDIPPMPPVPPAPVSR